MGCVGGKCRECSRRHRPVVWRFLALSMVLFLAFKKAVSCASGFATYLARVRRGKTRSRPRTTLSCARCPRRSRYWVWRSPTKCSQEPLVLYRPRLQFTIGLATRSPLRRVGKSMTTSHHNDVDSVITNRRPVWHRKIVCPQSHLHYQGSLRGLSKSNRCVRNRFVLLSHARLQEKTWQRPFLQRTLPLPCREPHAVLIKVRETALQRPRMSPLQSRFAICSTATKTNRHGSGQKSSQIRLY